MWHTAAYVLIFTISFETSLTIFQSAYSAVQDMILFLSDFLVFIHWIAF